MPISAASGEDSIESKGVWMKFDFGTSGSPVSNGYIGVSNTLIYNSERGYGLDRSASSRDRGAPDDLRRDFTNGTYGFTVDVPNGNYHVKIISGDQIASNNTEVSIEGIAQGAITSKTGEFSEMIRNISVTDGQLNFMFSRDGRVNAIELNDLEIPSGLTVQSKSYLPEASVSLVWEAVYGAASYNIYRTGDGEGTPVQLGASHEARYNDTTVELGKTYQYAVTHVNPSSIESGKSEALTVKVYDDTKAPPAPPGGLFLLETTDDSVSIAWAAADDAAYYRVWRAASPAGPFVHIGNSIQAQYSDPVETSKPYYYRLDAVGEGGMSQLSDVIQSPISRYMVRQMEKLDRGLVAVQSSQGIYLGWRMLGTDPQEISFNLYRNGQKINAVPISNSTNYVDAEGTADSVYYVRALLNGNELAPSDTAKVWGQGYYDLPLQKPADGVSPDGKTYTYSANDASAGDLDGDGQYEIVLKWDPSNSKDNSISGYTGPTLIDAYKLDGTQLWRVDLGRNIRAGAHYSPFMVYDLDGDGRAEVAMKTADGTIDGMGTPIGNPSADYRNASGYVLNGPEYLTIFEGSTGRAMATTEYDPPRGRVSDWGDSYGNRVDRFLAGIAYLDGKQPSLIMARGYYTRSVLAAYNWREGQLSKQWTFDTDKGYSSYAGQGNHQLSVADVDGDGRDEIIYGAMAVDDDGSGLYTTRLGHGDAMHLSDLDPDRPGLEVFQVHEEKSAAYGLEFRDAHTGALIWGVRTGQDTGRGAASDIDPRYRGAEAWALAGGIGGVYSAAGEKISSKIPPANHLIWWDGDPLREILDHTMNEERTVGVGTIGKWDYENSSVVNLLTAAGTFSNNTTKGNPSLQGDILGDWREEVLWRTEDSTALRIYTTTELTNHRIYTLMHDPVYRLGITWQNSGYNQPPHTSYFLGHSMAEAPIPNISLGKPIEVAVNIHPEVLHMKSNGQISVDVMLSSDTQVSQVQASSFRLLANGKVIHANASKTNSKVILKLNRDQLREALSGLQGHIQITVIGTTTEGTALIGKDTIQLIEAN
jgi:fibronectin type 3 domain-containing protein